ncbi:S-adenosyl-L-methionine-dependent methyltransferase [Fimicolochytrium jonesii]|uniref:S-adenosyl-L-methionine-dependent methyltransferase n=1 Tax=Fimicolochytrium jonesii TaxID=1396493 RepID=UPI0022FE9D5D|nr:S-adenosyl-L-methionine-dependent methyltransferase [Fimicolochytrium jonesii]KAI8822243.1 S-adenosyl-L-methionine-dependent methyltransferase [Fimicolochytrium jonesii]
MRRACPRSVTPLLPLWRLPRQGRAAFATASALPPTQQIFNRSVKKLQRDRAALRPESRDVDYIRDEVADRVVDRLLDIKRRFSKVVDLGSGAGHIVKFAEKDMMDKLIMFDMSEKMLYRDKDVKYEVPVERIVGDEEWLPFEENSLDAVISSLSLNWVNDIPGTLIQIQRALKPDGLFIGAMFGGETLFELRTALQLAEIDREGGVSPHISPMTDSRDVAALLQRAKYNLITVDVDEIAVSYPSMFELMDDLRAMGESNAIMARKPFLSRDTLLAAAAAYKGIYGQEDGSIPATFQIIYMIGWKPDPSQPKPLPRGSQEVSFKSLEQGGKVPSKK